MDPVVRHLAEEIANQAVTIAKLKAENESLQNEMDVLLEEQMSETDDETTDSDESEEEEEDD